MEANSLFKRSPSRIAARHMRPPGEELGAQAWEACMLRIHYRSMTQAKKQGSDCWRLPSFFLSPKQHSVAAKFEPLRAEPNGFLVHLLGHSDTLSCLFLPPTFSTKFTHPARMAIFHST